VELASVLGRLLKIDDMTFNKERLDYARLLLTTCVKRSKYFIRFLD
jgi:hypothetical protein